MVIADDRTGYDRLHLLRCFRWEPGFGDWAGESVCASWRARMCLSWITRESNVLVQQCFATLFGDREREGRPASEDDRIPEETQLVDEAELHRGRGQVSAAPLTDHWPD